MVTTHTSSSEHVFINIQYVNDSLQTRLACFLQFQDFEATKALNNTPIFDPCLACLDFFIFVHKMATNRVCRPTHVQFYSKTLGACTPLIVKIIPRLLYCYNRQIYIPYRWSACTKSPNVELHASWLANPIAAVGFSCFLNWLKD